MNCLFDDEPPKQRLEIGVETGQVMTVLGPVPVEDMGITLMHEHILLDGARTWKCPCHPDEKAIAEQPVNIEIIGELRMNPYMNRDNVSLDDADLALSELKRYQALGGHTVVDATNIGIGREPEKLARISRMSGLKIVMGTGFYLEHTHPEWLKAMDVDAVTEFIVNDVGGGETQPAILAGPDRRDRRQQGFHPRRAKVADRLRAGVTHHRRAAVDPSARLGAAGAQGARRRGSGGRRPSPHRALPHEPQPRRSRLSEEPRPARRLPGIRHDRHGLLLRRSGRAIALRRGECARHRGTCRQRASATACCCRRTCSSRSC